jgi:hypothetical protein
VIDGEKALVDVVDTSMGQYLATSDSLMRSGDGFLLVYNVTDLHSFQKIRAIHTEIVRAKDIILSDRTYQQAVVGILSDFKNQGRAVLTNGPIHFQASLIVEGEILARELDCPFIETAVTNHSKVNEAFFGVVREIRRKVCVLHYITESDLTILESC